MADTQFYAIPIEGLEDYLITEDGRVWSNKSGKFLTGSIVNGYRCVSLNDTFHTVGRLVAATFLQNEDPENLVKVNHIDGNYLNDHVDNLRWATQKTCVNNNTTKKTSHERRVQQIENGIVIATYDSVTEAGKAVGVTRHAISKVCVGKNKSSAGYQWKYEDSNHEHEYTDLSGAVQVYDYENYFVFPDGRIYNSQRKSFLVPNPKPSGYQYVALCMPGRKKINKDVHKIVADHFLDKPEGTTQVDHLDMNRKNNHVDNLEWVTQSENMRRASIARSAKSKEVSGTKLEEKSSDGPSQPLGEIKVKKADVQSSSSGSSEPEEELVKRKIRIIRKKKSDSENSDKSEAEKEPIKIKLRIIRKKKSDSDNL